MSINLHRGEGTQIFRGFISDELQQFHTSREKYVTTEAARSVIRGLVNDENIPNHQQTESIDSVKFKNTSQALVNEIFELQCGGYTCTLSCNFLRNLYHISCSGIAGNSNQERLHTLTLLSRDINKIYKSSPT